MTTLTEGKHAGEFIVSEANGSRTRDAVVVLSGETLVAGAVVGKVTATGKYREYNPGNIDGTETAVGVIFDAVDASAADADGVALLRDAEVNISELTWFSGASAGQITTGLADLAAVGIIGR